MARGFARQRDANEPEIVRLLEFVGASVQALNGTGVPDLLVGFRGRTFLLEVKARTATGRAKRSRSDADARGLLETQQKWWSSWKGDPPIVVTSAQEALDAIGFTTEPEPKRSP